MTSTIKPSSSGPNSKRSRIGSGNYWSSRAPRPWYSIWNLCLLSQISSRTWIWCILGRLREKGRMAPESHTTKAARRSSTAASIMGISRVAASCTSIAGTTIWGSLRPIRRKAGDSTNGQGRTPTSTKGNSGAVKEMAGAYSGGAMEADMRATSRMAYNLGMEFFTGKIMRGSMKAAGLTGCLMGKEYSTSKTEKDSRGHSRRISSTGKVFSTSWTPLSMESGNRMNLMLSI